MTTTRLTRHALIVATANYNDSRLAQLRSPAADAQGLAEVLSDPDRGDFDVQVGIDETHADLTRKIALFFRDRIPNDLLLLHLSCHGVKDENGELYSGGRRHRHGSAQRDGDLGRLAERADRPYPVAADRRAAGLLLQRLVPAPACATEPVDDMDAPNQLQGRGRAIITASNVDGVRLRGRRTDGRGPALGASPRRSSTGLRTGKADLDMDHLISIDDLYHYVYDRVRERTPTPDAEHQERSSKGCCTLRAAPTGRPLCPPSSIPS